MPSEQQDHAAKALRNEKANENTAETRAAVMLSHSDQIHAVLREIRARLDALEVRVAELMGKVQTDRE